MKRSILQPGQSYTFSDYFDLPFQPEDILAEFGYSLERSRLSLPRTNKELDRLSSLKQRIEESLPYISTTSEATRREFLIAPVLVDLIHYTHCKIVPEYLLIVSEQLKGSLHYYLYKENSLLVIEAKKADLGRGFTQLAVELIALNDWTNSDSPTLSGVVSTGNIWQFGVLYRDQRQIVRDLSLYRVPDDLEDLQRILIELLTSSVKGESGRQA